MLLMNNIDLLQHTIHVYLLNQHRSIFFFPSYSYSSLLNGRRWKQNEPPWKPRDLDTFVKYKFIYSTTRMSKFKSSLLFCACLLYLWRLSILFICCSNTVIRNKMRVFFKLECMQHTFFGSHQRQGSSKI